MNYETYDELIAKVSELLSTLNEYSKLEQDKIIRKILKINQASIMEIDGTSDLISSGESQEYERSR